MIEDVRVEGEVTKVIRDRGFGFAEVNGETVFLHAKQFTNPQDFEGLEEDDKITLIVRKVSKGVQGFDVELVVGDLKEKSEAWLEVEK